MTGRRAVAIIPARGGSKGIPRKNLRRVGGETLIERAVRGAAASGVELVVVSTDDDEIAAVAASAGARVVRRPAELAGDTASSESAVLHALDALEQDGDAADVAVLVQATSPFLPVDGIAQAVRLVRDGRFDSVFAASETFGFLWRRDAAGVAAAINHDAAVRPRRQDREPHYLETGAFYAFTVDGFRRAGHRFFGRIGIVEVPERTAIEIDSPQQLALADALAALHPEEGGAAVARDADPSGSPASAEAAEAPLPVTAVVTDFDGVHTDDTAYVGSDGRELVRVSRRDGMGVSLLRRAGIPMLILSTETNPVVARRAEKLRVPVLHGVEDKAAALASWAEKQGVALDDVVYLGNDVNDLPAMRIVGWPAAVADAHPEVLAAARIVLNRPGGHGAVRELVELVLPR